MGGPTDQPMNSKNQRETMGGPTDQGTARTKGKQWVDRPTDQWTARTKGKQWVDRPTNQWTARKRTTTACKGNQENINWGTSVKYKTGSNLETSLLRAVVEKDDDGASCRADESFSFLFACSFLFMWSDGVVFFSLKLRTSSTLSVVLQTEPDL